MGRYEVVPPDGCGQARRAPTPLRKTPEISPIFKADKVTLHVSREKGGKPESQQKAKGWPKRPNTLSGTLRRIAPPLRKIVDVVFERDPDKKRARKIAITCRPVGVGIMSPTPLRKTPEISPIFKADKVTLHVSREKGGKPESQQRAKGWPKRPNTLSGTLRRIAPPLRKIGVDVVFERDPDKERARKIAITCRPVGVGKTSSRSSASSETSDIHDLQRTIPDPGSSAIREGIVRDDGADDLSDDPDDEIVRCNPLKNQASDDPDDADELLHNFTRSHVCAQCHGPPDGKERPVAYGDETIWLHAECERFYVEAETLPW